MRRLFDLAACVAGAVVITHYIESPMSLLLCFAWGWLVGSVSDNRG